VPLGVQSGLRSRATGDIGGMGIARHAWTHRYGPLSQNQWVAKRFSAKGFWAVLLYPLKWSPTAIVPGVSTSA
jgi:hypothetical protein